MSRPSSASRSDDFAVAGNRVIWPVFFGSLARRSSGRRFAGNAGAAYSDGYVYMFAFFAFAVQTILVGAFVAPRLKRYAGAHTVGDVMAEDDGRLARLSPVSCPSRCAPASSVPGAGHRHRGRRDHRGVDVPAIVIGMAVVVAYSTFGGAWAVIQTDMLQFVVLGVFLPWR